MTVPVNAAPSATNPYLNATEWGGWRWDDGADKSGTVISYYFDSQPLNLNGIFGEKRALPRFQEAQRGRSRVDGGRRLRSHRARTSSCTTTWRSWSVDGGDEQIFGAE